MGTPSEQFLMRTNKRSIYNIQSIKNIPSIIEHGLLSYNHATRLRHESIAMTDVQSRRDNVIIPGGGALHSYASMYFDPRNPMMYRLKDIASTLCVLAVSASVLNIDGVVVSDGNAASEYTRFYSPDEGIAALDFAAIYSEWWTSDEPYRQMMHKRIKCAEILVPSPIDYTYVVGAIVVNEQVRNDLLTLGFNKTIVVRPKVFFSKEVCI